LLNERELAASALPVSSEKLAALILLVEDGKISRTAGSSVLDALFDAPNKTPDEIVAEKGLAQVSDTGAIEALCREAIEKNPSAAMDYRGGKQKALTSLVGFVMKQSKGKANPAMVNKLLVELLNN